MPEGLLAIAGGGFIIAILLWLAIAVGVVFLWYFIIKAAVRNGTYEAHKRLENERAMGNQWRG